ncbi:MAG: recombinase family protein [Rickettsia endosymbiont of Oxypoda opaca]|nr:recombinase family protein [Rickettsia endosymbiont of Oxypoda opaca]
MKDRKIATKAILLSRVSTKEQEEGYSIDAQTRRLQDYCMRKGLEILKIYEFSESSTVGNREKFNEAIKFAKSQKEIIAIITDKVDRLQRSFKESAMLYDLIEREKIELHFHVENCVIHKYSTSSEKLMWNLNVTMAQSYVDNIRDNVIRSIEQKLLSGEWISTAPIGYEHINVGKRQGDIIIDTHRAALIKKLFEEYATGLYTIPKMLQKTKEWGLTNSRGNQGELCRSHIHATLTNPFYYGVMHYKKANKYYPHRYAPIISKELFDQCTAVLKGWNKKPFKWGDKDYIFRGLITCATTGRVVSAETKKKKRADGSEYEVTYLGARNPNNPNKKVYVKEETLLEEVEKVFKAMYVEPETLQKVTQYVKDSVVNEREYYKTRITELNKELISIKTKLDKLMNCYLEDQFTSEEYEEKKKQLIVRRDKIMMEIEEHNKGDDSFNQRMIDVLNLAANAHKTFLGSTNEKKRQLIKLIFSTIKLNGSKLDYSLRSPFDTFVNLSKIEEWLPGPDSNQRPNG